MTDLSHTLSERHTADFEMIANGGFAPLTGFQGSEDWNRVCAEMRTAAGRILADPDHPGHRSRVRRRRRGRAVQRRGQAPRSPHRRGDLRARRTPRGRAGLRHRRRGSPGGGGDLRGGRPLRRRADRGRRPSRPRGGLHAPLPDPGGVAQGLRGARLEAGRRLPDPQPDPSRPRVPDQGGPGDLRRPLHPPADRQDQGRRHPCRRADALLRGADGELLPAGPGDPRGQPLEDALRRSRARRSCTRSSAATTAAPTSSSVATMPASAITTAPTMRRRSSTTSTSPSSGSSR